MRTPSVALGQQLGDRSGCREIVVMDAGGGIPAHEPAGTSGDPVPVRALALEQAMTPGAQLADAVAILTFDGEPAAPVGELVTELIDNAMFTICVWPESASPPPVLAEFLPTAVFRGAWSHGAAAGSGIGIWEAGTHPHSQRLEPPPGFEVVAFVTVFNEEDVLEPVLDDLSAQGVKAYVLDNWSTDDSWDIVQERLGAGVVGAERWPSKPAKYFDLKASLARIAELTRSLDADWFIKHDADEIRRAPWPDVTLAQGLWMVQCAGYNVVDFTVINHPPVDDDFARGRGLWEHFPYVEFGRLPGHFKQLKAWRNFGQQLDYAQYGSHLVAFEGVRVFPYKFELHHYPVRSQAHGNRKVMQERKARYLPAAVAFGWHTQYDEVSDETNFIRDPAELIEWASGRDRLVIERLSGAGLPRDPVPAPKAMPAA